MENRIYVSIPLDALIVSGITSDCAVQISAMDGAILIERCDDDCEECCCDCICDECRAEFAGSEDEQCSGCSESSVKKEELQFLLKSVSESDSDTTMFYHSPSRMTARYLSDEKKSATTASTLNKISRKISPLKISSTACQKKNRETHFCIFLCCGQKNLNNFLKSCIYLCNFLCF